MKRLYGPIKTLVIAAALALAALAVVPGPAAIAATPNVTPGAGQVVTIPVLIAGQRTATQTAVVRFAMPFPCDVLGFTASARVSGGTSPTLTVDLLVGGASILSAAVTVTAGAVAEGTIATAAVADEGVVTVNTAIGGTSPTWDDIMVLITVVRK